MNTAEVAEALRRGETVDLVDFEPSPEEEAGAAQIEAHMRLEAQGIDVGPPDGYTEEEWAQAKQWLPPPIPLGRLIPAMRTWAVVPVPSKVLAIPEIISAARRRGTSRAQRRVQRRRRSGSSRDGPDDPEPEPLGAAA